MGWGEGLKLQGTIPTRILTATDLLALAPEAHIRAVPKKWITIWGDPSKRTTSFWVHI